MHPQIANSLLNIPDRKRDSFGSQATAGGCDSPSVVASIIHILITAILFVIPFAPARRANLPHPSSQTKSILNAPTSRVCAKNTLIHRVVTSCINAPWTHRSFLSLRGGSVEATAKGELAARGSRKNTSPTKNRLTDL